MLFVQKQAAAKQELVTDRFYGYNHNLQIADGEFYDMENLTSDDFPMLAPRACRMDASYFSGVLQGMTVRDGHIWDVRYVGEVSKLYGNGTERTLPQGVNIDTGITQTHPQPERKQLVNMGAYVCIFPDGIYYNKKKSNDCGYMKQENSKDTGTYNLSISLCTLEGGARGAGAGEFCSAGTFRGAGIRYPAGASAVPAALR